MTTLQGIVFSETAATNYVDPETFNRGLHIIPARRLGYPEEVRPPPLYWNLSFIPPPLSLLHPTPFSPLSFLLSLTLSLPTHMCRCLARCVSCSLRVPPTSQAALYQWMEARAYTDHRGLFRVRILYNYTEHAHTIIQFTFA